MNTKTLDSGNLAPATTEKTPRSAAITSIACWGISLVVVAVLIFVSLTPLTAGGLILLLTIALLFAGVPIAIATLLAGALGLWAVGSTNMVTSVASETIFNTATQWALSVIPGFVMMGALLGKAGLVAKLFDSARVFIGRLPGGLALGTTIAGSGLASISGSTIGVTHALGRVALPSMLQAGYDKRLATGAVSIVGTLGGLIPPSIVVIIYAGVAQTSVGNQLLATLAPAMLLALSYGILIIVRSAINKDLAPTETPQRKTLKLIAKSVGNTIPVLVVFCGVVGGMFLGIFTATEAAAFGVFSAVIVAWIFNPAFRSSPRLFLVSIKDAALDAIVATATIFLLLTGVGVLTSALTLSRITNLITDTIVGMELGRIGFLLVLVIVYLILGMFLDPTAMILLTVPILMEPLGHYGIDMIWFGVFILILAEVAQVTPPVGILAYVVHNIAKDPEANAGQKIELGDVFRGSIPFVGVTLLVLGILILFPEIATIFQPIQ